jgi:hypothetical protein
VAERLHDEPPFDPFERPPGPPGDWTRLANEALGGNFEAFRDHLADAEERECVAWCPVCRLADVLRANATPEMREQWGAVQRELLLAIRSLADHYLEGAERRRRGDGPRVEDIPVE